MREEERRRREREKESRSPSGLKREQREPIMIPPHPLTFSQNQKTDYPRLLIFDEREDPFSRRNEKRRNVVVVVCRVKCAPSVVGVRVATSSPLPPFPRWWSLVLAQLGPRRREGKPWAGRDTNPRGDAFHGDGRLVEACRHVQRSRPRVGSRDRSPRRTPTEITGSRNRRDTLLPLIMDIFAMETRMGRGGEEGDRIGDVSTTSVAQEPLRGTGFSCSKPIRILLLFDFFSFLLNNENVIEMFARIKAGKDDIR